MKKRKKKKKDNFPLFILAFIVLGAISFSLDPDGFGDNVYQVGRGFVYIIFLIIFGLVMVKLSKDKDAGEK